MQTLYIVVAVLLVLLAAAARRLLSKHPINDIHVPHGVVHEFPTSEKLSKYNPKFLAIQKRCYGDLEAESLVLKSGHEGVFLFREAQAVAESLGWRIVHSDPKALTFQAEDTTKLMRFVDDIVVRLIPNDEEPDSYVIGVRSRSRVGRSDLGANAARIRRFTEALVLAYRPA
mmetsp:Transcript_12482/g.31648  ORF Transcript_12482/g.31648 Transcript_12482/m.31648 type:complete len:172 (-) Transcript_12482:100-615(-)